MNLSDTVVSIIRTMIPVTWGSIVAWLLTLVPVLAEVEAQVENLGEILALVVVGLWYSGTRAIENRLPDWLRKALFGVSSAPEYDENKLGA